MREEGGFGGDRVGYLEHLFGRKGMEWRGEEGVVSEVSFVLDVKTSCLVRMQGQELQRPLPSRLLSSTKALSSGDDKLKDQKTHLRNVGHLEHLLAVERLLRLDDGRQVDELGRVQLVVEREGRSARVWQNARGYERIREDRLEGECNHRGREEEGLVSSRQVGAGQRRREDGPLNLNQTPSTLSSTPPSLF